MMHVNDAFGAGFHNLLHTEIDEGYISQRKHPLVDLYIYNYTPATQYSRRWNAATIACRGLILDYGWHIVARPYAKFFNYGDDLIDFDLDVDVEVTDKMDGSLGILYAYEFDGEWHDGIATRGSFESDQAIHATKIWHDKYKGLALPSAHHTALFEIIYPDNRIVLDYEGLDDLVLLGAVNKNTGKYYGPETASAIFCWDGPITSTFEYKSLREALTAPARPNSEGFVVRSGNTMVKIKQDDYLELHKLIFSLTEKALWEQLSAGKTIKEILEPIPDEFMKWAEDVCLDLTKQVDDIFRKVIIEFYTLVQELPEGFTKKDFALKALQSHYKALLFNIYDSKPTGPTIWKMVKPKHE